MFAQLIASHPVRRRSPAGFAASLVLHGVIVTGALIATSHAAAPPVPHAAQVVIQYRAPVPQPLRETPTPPQAPTLLHLGPSVISVPIEVPVDIPPITSWRALINTDEPLAFRIGAPSHPGTSDIGALISGGGVLLADQVEIPVVLDRHSPLPRFPQVLRDAGVEGAARVSFVVDTLGRVELETAVVVESTHSAFALAVKATLPRLRFTPARVGAHAVRQLVEFPVQFRLDK